MQPTDPAELAYRAWNDALLRRVDHRIECQDGCTQNADVCEIGTGLARLETRLWLGFHSVRPVEVPA